MNERERRVTVVKLARWAKEASESNFHLDRLNIGPRLTLCFLSIILALLLGNAVLLWQFHQARAQAERLGGVDQELIAVLQTHISLMSFYERLDALAHSESTDDLLNEAETIRNALLQNSRRTRNALSELPPQVQIDPALLPTLLTIQDTLPAELEGIIALAQSRDWEAVRLRLSNQVRPLESRSEQLVENIDREVGKERAQAVLNITGVQRKILIIVPITAMLTLLFAAFLGLAVTRSITQPLRRLMQGSRALARGEFGHRVPAGGNDEIGRLGNVFNDMIVRLQELYRELQRKESYLAEAQLLSHTGSWGWDVSSGKIHWSLETFRIFEYALGSEPTIEGVIERTHPEDRSSVQQLVGRVSREREAFDFEHRLLMPDGSVKYLHVVGRPSTDVLDRFELLGAVTDITERKRAEAALQRSSEELAAQRAQLEELFEQAPEGIALLDVEDRVLRINSEFTRIFGYAPEEAIGRAINDLIAPDELRHEAEEYTKRLLHGKAVNAETIRRRKDGTRVHVSLLAVPISVPGGQIAEYAIYRDMTERKMVEGELAKQRAHLDELFETIPEAIALVDLRDVIVRVNPEFSKIFGYSSGEAVGRPLNELVAPGELRKEAEEFTKLVTRRGETLNVETIRGRKDGSRFPVSILGVPVAISGSQVAEYAIYRDITERKRAEEELQQLVDSVPQVIVVLGPDGKWIHANRVAQEYTGLTLDEYRSMDVIGRVIHPDDAEKVRAERKLGLSGSSPFEQEARLLGKDGVYRWFLFRFSPLVEGGRVKRWYGTATEIESRKKQEERVRQENVLLEDRSRIAQELHDTLLQSFLGASMQLDAAMKNLPSGSPVKPKLEQVLELMEQGIEEGRATIQGLRSSDSRPWDLVLALSGVQQELGVPSDIDFRVSVEGREQPLRPDIRQEIYRIGKEALVNAFCHSGAKRVDCELEYTDSGLRMRVRDNGRGIDPQVLDAGREGHWGLRGMRERATRIGAVLKISTSAAVGTEVQLSIPSRAAFTLSPSDHPS
jgi:PAS domain S-box-containing protein